MTCAADGMGECNWQIEAVECPACDRSECGPLPDFSPRLCPDGSTVVPNATCRDNGGSCEWEFSGGECAPMMPGEPCDVDFCDGPRPETAQRPCADGSFVTAPVDCVADGMGEACEWRIGSAECPLCDASECGPEPALSPRLCANGAMVFPDIECRGEGSSCEWDISGGECPALMPGEPCDASACGPAPEFAPRLCCDGRTLTPDLRGEVNIDGEYCEWNVGAVSCR